MQYSEQGDQSPEQHKSATKINDLVVQLKWDDLQLLGEVASQRSFRKAALKLKLSVNTVRARVDRLEAALQTIVFRRAVSGLSITAEGHTILKIATKMQVTSSNLPYGLGNRSLAYATPAGVKTAASRIDHFA